MPPRRSIFPGDRRDTRSRPGTRPRHSCCNPRPRRRFAGESAQVRPPSDTAAPGAFPPGEETAAPAGERRGAAFPPGRSTRSARFRSPPGPGRPPGPARQGGFCRCSRIPGRPPRDRQSEAVQSTGQYEIQYFLKPASTTWSSALYRYIDLRTALVCRFPEVGFSAIPRTI